MDRMRVIVVGAGGRMGRLVCRAAMESTDVTLVGAIVGPQSPSIGRSSAPEFSDAPNLTDGYSGPADAVIDFSTNDGAAHAVAIAQQANAALVTATTGLSESNRAFISAAAKEIPALIASNTSLGVAVCRELVERTARLLGAEYQVDIVESHHRHKRDAPSGTALTLGESAGQGGAKVEPSQYHSLRGGDVVGEHTVRFAGPGEYVEIRHVAVSRSLFALGAIRAARWLVGRGPGLYDMRDVLGLSDAGER